MHYAVGVVALRVELPLIQRPLGVPLRAKHGIRLRLDRRRERFAGAVDVRRQDCVKVGESRVVDEGARRDAVVVQVRRDVFGGIRRDNVARRRRAEELRGVPRGLSEIEREGQAFRVVRVRREHAGAADEDAQQLHPHARAPQRYGIAEVVCGDRRVEQATGRAEVLARLRVGAREVDAAARE